MNNPNIFISLLFSLVDSGIFIILLSKFRSKDKYYKKIDIFVIISIALLTTILTGLQFTPYIKVILLSLFLFLTTFIYKLKFYEQILIVVMHYFILIISELLVTFLANNILQENLISLNTSDAYFFLALFSKFLAILILTLINKKFLKAKILLPKSLNYLAILILTFYIASMILLFYFSLSLSSKTSMLILFLISLLTFFSVIGYLKMYFSANSFYIDLQKQTAKEIYNKSYEKFIHNAEIKEDALSKIWHDIENHISVLEKMDNKKDSTQPKYIDSIKNTIKKIPNTINTGNKLVDIILNDKHQDASLQEINFHAKAVVPPDINIDKMDLSSILFNTIDNAIEACLNQISGDKYIYLELLPDGNFLCYKIKNSYSEDRSQPFKKLYSNKKHYISSGYGLSIVKDIVDKYDGYIDISKDNKEYSVDIILHLS